MVPRHPEDDWHVQAGGFFLHMDGYHGDHLSSTGAHDLNHQRARERTVTAVLRDATFATFLRHVAVLIRANLTVQAD